VDLVFRLLHQFSDQFSSLETLGLEFRNKAHRILYERLVRTIDGLACVARHGSVEAVLCATVAISSA
jgi:hypothetical protein